MLSRPQNGACWLLVFAEVQVQCILPLFGCVMTYVDTHIYIRGHAGSAQPGGDHSAFVGYPFHLEIPRRSH